MFELFKLLDARAHISYPIVINNTILFVFEDKKITLQATQVTDIYDVFQNDKYQESMTENEIISKFQLK